MSGPDELVLAVDGGNVKTDLALVGGDGRLLALVRGGGSSPHHIGLDGCLDLLEELIDRACAAAGLNGVSRLRATAAQIMLAGADLPEELAALREGIAGRRWAERLTVDNDTFALLRSGTDRGWGVAVVCGGGINCVGRAPDGREVRFPSLGAITGDWGGGHAVGLAALFAAARSADGRGPRTALETAVPAHFGLADWFALARALHLGEMASERLGELARVVYAVAGHDEVASEIVDHLGDEVVAFATATLRRLALTSVAADVVLGGGLLRAAPPAQLERIAAHIGAVAPAAEVRLASAPPIVGAALLALDELGADAATTARASAELEAAFAGIEGDGARIDPAAANGAFSAAPEPPTILMTIPSEAQ